MLTSRSNGGTAGHIRPWSRTRPRSAARSRRSSAGSWSCPSRTDRASRRTRRRGRRGRRRRPPPRRRSASRRPQAARRDGGRRQGRRPVGQTVAGTVGRGGQPERRRQAGRIARGAEQGPSGTGVGSAHGRARRAAKPVREVPIAPGDPGVDRRRPTRDSARAPVPPPRRRACVVLHRCLRCKAGPPRRRRGSAGHADAPREVNLMRKDYTFVPTTWTSSPARRSCSSRQRRAPGPRGGHRRRRGPGGLGGGRGRAPSKATARRPSVSVPPDAAACAWWSRRASGWTSLGGPGRRRPSCRWSGLPHAGALRQGTVVPRSRVTSPDGCASPIRRRRRRRERRRWYARARAG